MSERFAPRDPAFAERVGASFARQTLMATLGARLRSVAPGLVEVELARLPGNLQQHGFVHGGAVAAIADSAAGYAALSLMAPGRGVLTVEFKLNFVGPASQAILLARGRVEKAGRTLTVVRSEVFGVEGERLAPVAVLLGTMMAIEQREGVVD